MGYVLSALGFRAVVINILNQVYVELNAYQHVSLFFVLLFLRTFMFSAFMHGGAVATFVCTFDLIFDFSSGPVFGSGRPDHGEMG